MAIETKIDGGKQAITFNNDAEPCAVYVNGELQENVSFVPQTVQGTGAVSYESEYKKNHIEIEIDGNTIQSILPSEYQQVEYIESTGTQYIDTGIVASPIFEMVAVAQFPQNYAGTSGNAWTGIGISPSRIGFGYASSISNEYFTVLFASTANKTGIPFDTNKHEFVIQGNGKGKWNIDGSTGNYVGEIDSEFSKGTLPFILFGRYGTSGIGGFLNMRLYSFKFTDNNALIRDFIPCYRKADNEIGLFDLVNGVFYTNQGTGTFLKGTDYSTLPTPDAPIPVENANSEGMSVVLHGDNFREEITIPASVNGIPLRFAGGANVADKLIVDRISNTTNYIQAFTQYEMQGDEAVFGTASTTNGNIEATLFILPSPLPDDSKYLLQWCNCAQNAAVATSGDRNLFEVFEGNGYCLARFKFLNCASLADMRNIFINKKNNGTPVTVQYVLATPVPHTLSGATFGQSLLNLATENEINYFEVQGNVPEIPLKITYAKWGGNLENNSNT